MKLGICNSVLEIPCKLAWQEPPYLARLTKQISRVNYLHNGKEKTMIVNKHNDGRPIGFIETLTSMTVSLLGRPHRS